MSTSVRSETPLASIVIPTRNEARNIGACIQAFSGAVSEGWCEVLVVDNGSTDHTPDLAREQAARVFLQGPERSAQRNRGWRESRGQFVFFVDADMRVPAGTLAEIKVRLSSDTPPEALYVREQRVGNGWWIRVRNFERSFYDGTCIDGLRVFRRTLLADVGGYDEALYACEDWDLDRRVLSRTRRIAITEGALLHDEGELSLRKHLRKKAYYSSNFHAYQQKWGWDSVTRRQFGVLYRFVVVFLEHGKWKRALRHPVRMLAIVLDRVLVGLAYLRSRTRASAWHSNMKKLLFVTSDQSGRFDENTPAGEMFQAFPFSMGAIRFNLEKLGWTTRYLSIGTCLHPIRLAGAIDRFQPDIIYTYGGTVSLNPMICRKLLCRHKAFRVIHGWDDVYGEVWEDVHGRVPGALMHWLERRIIKNSDGVVTLSYFNQQRGRAWGVESEYIPNGADVPQIDPSACDIKLSARFNLVYTGDMARWKRTWEVCEAMRHLPADIKLYLTGVTYPYLKPYASENCIFLGLLPKPAQLAVMAQADAFVVTANQDCNAKLQEYLRFKKPILGYDGRLNLFFKNGRNALLTRDYVSAIQQLANDPALCESLVRNAGQDIPVYTWLEIAEQFDAFFEQCIQAMRST